MPSVFDLSACDFTPCPATARTCLGWRKFKTVDLGGGRFENRDTGEEGCDNPDCHLYKPSK